MERRDILPHVLDASFLLNLIASRRTQEILQVLTGPFLVPSQAAAEVRYVRKGGDGIDAKEREVVDISVFQQDELLTVVDLRPGAEMTAFVEFATELDDGEAAACAMAVVRRGALVSDDRKARNVLSQRSPNTRILTTCEMMQTWAESVAISRSDLAKVLRDIEERASFRPGRNDPLWEWWQQIMNTDSLAE